MKKLVVLVFALLSSLAAQAADNPVIGTWRLQSYVREVSATGQRYNLFGDKPDGYIGYAPDGRMYAIFINTDRVPPRDAVPTDEEKAKLFSTITAYAGTYTLDSEKVVSITSTSHGTRPGRARTRCASTSLRGTP